jgi:hypothetical protein
MLHDVYGHVMADPAGDEWRSFWLEASDAARRPKRPEIARFDAVERAPREAWVRPEKGA